MHAGATSLRRTRRNRSAVTASRDHVTGEEGDRDEERMTPRFCMNQLAPSRRRTPLGSIYVAFLRSVRPPERCGTWRVLAHHPCDIS
jgi:hypothetical protein